MTRPIVSLLALCAAVAACHPQPELPAGLTGDAERGRALLSEYGCGACHTIPGVPRAQAKVGPPLSGIASRVYLAGVLTNTPANMARWIRAPRDIDPRTAMPNMNVTDAHANDMVAYLYRLR